MDQQTPTPNPVTPKPPIASEIPPVPVATPVTSENTSGMGDQGAVPEEVKGWSWAGFLWTWIWAIGNKTWIGLLALIGPVSFIIAIILGVKGREWAWKNKKWKSVEDFKKTQRGWVKWWLIIVLPLTVISILGIRVLTKILLNPQNQLPKVDCVGSFEDCRYLYPND